MSRRIALPDEAHVRHAMTEVITTARDQGKKPTVVALASQLGMSHSTFWRHFPDIANHLVDLARSHTPGLDEAASPNRYDQLAAEHARVKRANAELEEHLELAKSVIQRLSIENRQLRQQLEEAAQVTHLNRKRGDRLT